METKYRQTWSLSVFSCVEELPSIFLNRELQSISFKGTVCSSGTKG